MIEKFEEFEYEGNKVTFGVGENTMVNATEMSKPFDVRPAFWLRTDQAKSIIDAISSVHNCTHDDLVQVTMGSAENGGGTWFHEDIAIVYAQWLSPKFYIWCNDRIKELFKHGITALKPEVRETLFSLAEITKGIKNNADCKIGRFKIYEILRERGILNEKNQANPEYVGMGYFKIIPFEKQPSLTKTRVTEEGVKWLNQMFYTVQNINNTTEIYQQIADINTKDDFMLEGLVSIAEVILNSKVGGRTDEQNKAINARLAAFVKKVKDSQNPQKSLE
jgi:hypothetical protein